MESKKEKKKETMLVQRIGRKEGSWAGHGWALTCCEPLLERAAVDLDLNGVAVPGPGSREGLGERRRRREADELRVEQ